MFWSRSRSWTVVLGLALAAPLVVLSAAPALGAATLSGVVNSISYSDAGDTNGLTVGQSGSNLVFNDTGAAITSSGTCAGGACSDAALPGLTIAVGTGADTVFIDSSVSGHLSSITVQGGTGADVLINNSTVKATLDYSASAGPMTVDFGAGATAGPTGDGADTFAGFENVSGSGFGDKLAGDAGANVINANGGSDTVAGGGGDDVLDGGSGTSDTVTYSPIAGTSYSGAPSGVTVDFANQTATGEGTDTLSSFEIAVGSATDDTMIPGGGGNTLIGGIGNDRLVSGPGDDTFDGGGGVDTLDFSNNGVGVVTDLAAGFAAGAGSDTIVSNSVERVLGSAFDDQLTGDQNANFLVGQGGNDTLAGGGGDDVLQGGAGRDSADFSSSLSSITANLAAGTATGQGSDVLDAIENLTGSGLGDTLTGDSGDNLIQGAGGTDTIAGRGGDDILNGGASTDIVSFAGSSAPVFVTLPGGSATGEGADTLSAFEAVIGSNYADTINVRDTIAGGVQCGAGDDSAVVDVSDFANDDCETVDDGTPPPPPPPPPTVTVTAPAPPPVTVTAPAPAPVTVTAAAPPPVTETVTVPAPPSGPSAPPKTTIKTKPKATVKTHGKTAKVSFTFASTTKGATFKCKLDAAAFAGCTSPKSYSAKVGKHTFSVEAIAAGQTGPAATARFTVAKS